MSIDEELAKELIREAIHPDKPDERRLGRFVISNRMAALQGYSTVAAALEGCAVVRCEEMHHMRAFEYHAWHPDLDPVPDGALLPTYQVVMQEQEDGSTKRLRFEREGTRWPEREAEAIAADLASNPFINVDKVFIPLPEDEQQALFEETELLRRDNPDRKAFLAELQTQQPKGEAVNVGMPRKPDGESPALKEAYSAYWGAQTPEEERAAYRDIIRLGGKDGYASAEPAPFALTDQHAAALTRAIEAEGYRVMVDPETGDVKLERR